LVLQLHRSKIERPLAPVTLCLIASTLFTLLVLPTFHVQWSLIWQSVAVLMEGAPAISRAIRPSIDHAMTCESRPKCVYKFRTASPPRGRTIPPTRFSNANL
jgi:hypothetical protein